MSTGDSWKDDGLSTLEESIARSLNCRIGKTIRSRVEFQEVPVAYLSTCTFTRATFVIRIGDDKWGSGCVPHELGHAACEALGMPDGCQTFEHPNPERCE
jgi:hypothetical protein